MESPVVPSTSESAHTAALTLSSTTGRRVSTDLDIVDEEVDSGECNKNYGIACMYHVIAYGVHMASQLPIIIVQMSLCHQFPRIEECLILCKTNALTLMWSRFHRVCGKKNKSEWIISALDHLIDLKQNSNDRINMVVMSFGCQPIVTQVVGKLEELADLGVVLVAACGNSGPRPDDTDFPASDIHVISVGALDKRVGSKISFSSAHCHVYAPGECVYVPSVINQSITDVCHVDGTSFAAPILGGFLALLLESANNNVSNSTFVIEKCHDINFLNTLLKDHKLVRD